METGEGCNLNTKQCRGCEDNRLSARLKRMANMVARGRSPQPYLAQPATENKLTYCKQLVKTRALSYDPRKFRECE